MDVGREKGKIQSSSPLYETLLTCERSEETGVCTPSGAD